MLIYMSLSGGALICFILLLRATVSVCLPRQLFVLLWDLAAARLLLPVMIPAPFGLNALTADQPAAAAGESAAWVSPWIPVWLAGTIVAAGVMTCLYIREWRVLREALPAAENTEERLRKYVRETCGIRISDRITTPVLCGIFRPRIILPKGFSDGHEDTIRYALTHEMIHARRLDNLQKLVAAAAACIHWFNPLVWVMQIMLDRDLEKACDEAVIRRLGEARRWDYAQTLLELAAARKMWSVCGNGFGRSAVHERIRSMITHRKTGTAALIAGCVIVLVAMTAFAGAVPVSQTETDTFHSADILIWEVDLDTGEIQRDGRTVGSLDLPEGAIPGEIGVAAAGTSTFSTPAGTLPDIWFWVTDPQ